MENEIGKPIDAFPLIQAHSSLKKTLMHLQETRDSINYKDPVGRPVSVTITQTETALLWLQESARQMGVHLPDDNHV